MPRLESDEKLGRFWDHRGDDGVEREKQLLIDFLSNAAGGPVYYTGRDMKTAHQGMRIDEEDWERLIGHLTATLDSFNVPERERRGKFWRSLRAPSQRSLSNISNSLNYRTITL